MMTAQTLLSTSMTLITSTENVTNNVLNDESKVRCSTLRNPASIEAMQNFFRFAASILEFEEKAEVLRRRRMFATQITFYLLI